MELTMPRAGLYVTLRCNLRCKLCAAHVPYYENPWHPPVEELCRQIDRYFELVSYVGHFSMTGGEPAIRSDLDIVIRNMIPYKNQIGSLELFTNGTVVPEQKVFDAFKNYGGQVKIVIDDYGPDLSVGAHEFAEKAERELPNATIELRDYYSEDMHCGGWVDWGVGEKNRSDEETQEIFNKCSLPHKIDWVACMFNGVLYPCPQTRRCIELGLIEPNPKEVVDLFDKNCSDEELRKRIAGRYSLTILSACRCCDGQRDDSDRFRPAEQIS